MSRSQSIYCSCSTCTQIRNEQPKYYRYLHSLKELFNCLWCFSTGQPSFTPISSIDNNRRSSSITFRDIDITHKHCSKHDVMVKATRPHLTKMQNEEIRQRVRDANQRWTRMSRFPAHIIELIFDQKDFLPLCQYCDENFSPIHLNLCHRCIQNLLRLDLARFTLATIHEEFPLVSIQTDSTRIYQEKNRQPVRHVFIDYFPDESVT